MIDRRHFLSFAAGLLATPAVAQTGSPNMSRVTAYAFSFPGLEGGEIKLIDHAGKPILIVNTASQCGYTPQFEGLQQLHARYHARGLRIIAVPSNDFGGQEPGDRAEIVEAARHYHVAPSRLRPRRWCAARTAIRSIAGRRPSVRPICQAGISTNIWSAATAILPGCSRRRSSRWMPASSTRW